jgi:hypothetical protein
MLTRIKKLLAAFGRSEQAENPAPVEPYVSGPHPDEEPLPPSLMKQMFNVDGEELNVIGSLGNSQRNQTIFHLNAPDCLEDRRECGIPVKVRVPQANAIIETRLVPQWRFGKGMRTGEIRKLMRGKKAYRIFQTGNGDLTLEFS